MFNIKNKKPDSCVRRNDMFGFTLIELLISMAIIGIMATIAAFGINGARESSRDAKRRTDLQNIRTSFELFYSDCGQYPLPSSNAVPLNINSDLSSINNASCPDSIAGEYTYLSNVPTDPQGAVSYSYERPTATSYILCTYLEGGSVTADPVCSGLTCINGVCNHAISGP